MRIEILSDMVCPWCCLGKRRLVGRHREETPAPLAAATGTDA